MKMFLISDNVDTLTGMRLAGVDGIVVHERDETADALKKAVSDAEIGVVLITELLARIVPDIVKDIKLNNALPLVVEIPERHGTRRPPDYIMKYVSEAIGLKL
jgi:V/A-type H+-transporting ATPase subunit F